jgi:hypothetical protein
LLCGRAGGRAARPRAPGCRPSRGIRFSRGSKIYAQGVYFWVYMEVLKGISSFKRPTTACLRGCAATTGSDSGQRPGHSPWGYMQPALTSSSVEVAQTAGGCDSRRAAPAPGEPAGPRSSLSTADSHFGRRNHRTGGPVLRSPPPRGRAAGQPAGEFRQHHLPACQNDCGQRVSSRPLLCTIYKAAYS